MKGSELSQCSVIALIKKHFICGGPCEAPLHNACLFSLDTLELQRAKEHNERLDGEIRVLRERVRSLDSEKKTLLQVVRID